MPQFDTSDVQYFEARLRAQSATAQAPQGLGEYSAGLVYDLPKNVAYSARGLGQGLWDTFTGKPDILRQEEAQQRQEAKPDFLYSSDATRPPQNWMGTTAKIVGEDLIPELPGLMYSGGAIGRGAEAFGAGKTSAGIIGSMGAGALSGNREGGAEAATQAAEFGLMDVAGTLIPKARPLLRTAVKSLTGAAIPLAGQAVRGNDPFTEQNLTQAGIMAAFPLAGEGRRIFKRGNAAPEAAAPATAAPGESGIPADWKLRNVTETPEGMFVHEYDTPNGPQVIPHETKLGEPVGGFVQSQSAGGGAVNPNAPVFDVPPGEPPAAPPRRLLTPRPGRPELGYRDAHGNRHEGPGRWDTGDLSPEEIQRITERSAPISRYRQAETRPLIPTEETDTRHLSDEELLRLGGIHPDQIAEHEKAMRQQQPQGEAPQAPAKLRPLPGGESGAASGPLLRNLAATTGGALYGYTTGKDDDDKVRRALLFGGAGFGLHMFGPKIGKMLLRPVSGEAGERAAAAQLGKKNGGKSVAGYVRRVGEKYFKVGRSDMVDNITEQSRNIGPNIIEGVNAHAREIIPIARKMTPSQWGAYNIFTGSDRGAGAQKLMADAGVPPEVINFAVKSTEAERALQQIHADAQPNPSPRRTMFLNSIKSGNYQTKPYLAFEDAGAWQSKPVDPGLEAQILSENRADPRFAGMSDEAIKADWNAYKQDIQNHGEDVGKYSAGGQRVSESLFTARKKLRPSIEKFLGVIENPMQRQILTVHKLAKGASTAKAISEVINPANVDENGYRPGMTQPEHEAEIKAAEAAGDSKRVDFLRSNYEQVPDTMTGLAALAGGPQGPSFMVQRSVADALQIGAGHKMFTNDHTLLAMLNSVAKASHTILSPSTHVHNMVQVPMMAGIAGVAPWEIVTQNRRIGANPDRLRWAKEDGMLSAHMGNSEFKTGGEAFEHVLAPDFWDNAKGAKRKVGDAIKNVYGKPDQWVRAAKYMKELDRAFENGLTEKQARAYATEATNRTTQNYANVAGAVRVLRNLPLVNSFISYSAEMARVLKNRAVDFISDPMAKKYGAWASQKWAGAGSLVFALGAGSAIKALIQNSRMSDEDKQKWAELSPFLPDYKRGKTEALLSRKNGVDTTFNLNPLMPSEDFVTMAKNVANGDWEAFAQNNPIAGTDRSPVLNILAEQISHKDAMGRPSRGLLRNVAQNALPGWFPGNYQAEKLKQGFTRNDHGELGVTDSTGREETPGTAIASMFGFNVSRVSEPALFKRAKQEQDDAISAAKSNLRRVLGTNTNEEEKNAAKEKYQGEVRRILKR